MKKRLVKCELFCRGRRIQLLPWSMDIVELNWCCGRRMNGRTDARGVTEEKGRRRCIGRRRREIGEKMLEKNVIWRPKKCIENKSKKQKLFFFKKNTRFGSVYNDQFGMFVQTDQPEAVCAVLDFFGFRFFRCRFFRFWTGRFIRFGRFSEFYAQP